jgi:hypothetical protein
MEDFSMAKIYWDNSQGGSFAIGANWSGGVVPGAADDVTISIATGTLGSYYIYAYNLDLTLHSLTLDQADAGLVLNGGSLATDLILDAGTVDVGYDSLSGTIVGNGGFINASAGVTLQSETLVGSVQLGGFNETTITGGLTFATLHHTAASLVLNAATLDVAGSQTLNGGTIVLGGLNTSGSIGFLDFNTPPSTLTLGRSFDVVFNSNDTIGDSAAGTDTIVNDGTITGASGGGSLLLAEGTILNAGYITAGAGHTIAIDATNFTNRGTIAVTAGGTLSLAAAHLSNRGAIDIAGGTLALAGPTATLAELKLATFTDGGTAAFAGTISNAHRTLTLGAAAGLPSIELASGGIIEGGTLAANGGLTFTGGTLSGVTFETPLDLSEAGATLTVTGGLAGRAASGSGPGTVVLTGAVAALDLAGIGTLSNLVIDAGSGYATVGNEVYYGPSIDLGPSGGTTYTLAAGASIVQTGADLTIGLSGYYSQGEPLFINRGVISADVAGGDLTIDGPSVDNIGSISVGGGDELVIQSNGTFTNEGTLAVTAGGYLLVSSAFANAGNVIVAASGTLALEDNLTTAALGSLAVANGAALQLYDQIDNTGGTLTFGSGSTIAQAYLEGTITGGTVKASAGALEFGGGSFNDVTVDGVLSIGGAASQTLNAYDGFSATGAGGTGPGSIVLTGVAATLEFDQGGTLADAAVTYAASTGTITGGSYDVSPNQSTVLTLASSLAITQTGEDAVLGYTYFDGYYAGDPAEPGSDIATAASIDAAVGGGTLSLEGVLANTGTIAISNGETLAIDSQYLTNTGVISLAGGVLNLEYAELAFVESMALSNVVADVSGTLALDGGTLELANDGISLFRVGGSAAPGTAASVVTGGTIADPNGLLQLAGYSVFSGVTYEGTLSLSRPLASLDLIDGSSVTDSTGKLPGLIDLTGDGASLDTDTLDQVTIDIGSAALSYDGATLAPASLSAQVLGSGVTVDQTGACALFNQGDDTSSLATAATIEADVYRDAFGIWGGAVTSTGAISVSNADTLTIGSADFVNDGVITVSSGAIILDTLAHFASGTLTQSSFTNAGTVLLGGAIEEFNDGGGFPSLAFANEGSVEGSGTIDVGVINTGVVEATSGDVLLIEKSVGGSGRLQVDAGALLQVATVGGNQRVLFSGAGGALALAPMSFLGKIEGFASGDTIDLLNTAASSASFVGDSIVVSLTAGGTITLDTTSALSGSLTVAMVNRFNSQISFAGSSTHDALFTPSHGS